MGQPRRDGQRRFKVRLPEEEAREANKRGESPFSVVWGTSLRSVRKRYPKASQIWPVPEDVQPWLRPRLGKAFRWVRSTAVTAWSWVRNRDARPW